MCTLSYERTQMKLYRPVKTTQINQYFGKDKTAPNMLAFYNSIGLQGHNGWDFGTLNGTPFCFGGVDTGFVESVYWDYHGGNSLQIITDDGKKYYRLRFFHLKDITVKVGDVVQSGDLLGHTDNTGAGTTGPHLHYDIKEVVLDANNNYQSINKDNGYAGCLDPQQFDTGIFIGDYMDNLKSQISILQKIIDLIKSFLGL